MQLENLQSAFQAGTSLGEFLAILGWPFGRVLKIPKEDVGVLDEFMADFNAVWSITKLDKN